MNNKALGSIMGKLIQLVVIAILLGSAIYTASYWLSHKPKAKRRKKKRIAPLVKVKTLKSHQDRVRVSVLGTVIPSREVEISSLVQGRIKWVHKNFKPGGIFKKNELILKLDSSEFYYNYQIQQSQLKKMKSELKMELGKSKVAEQEYKSLAEDMKGGDQDLILRKPQLAATKASLESVRASMGQAYLNIKRTKLSTPFNAVLQSKNVDIGAKISPGTKCGTLVGTDYFWIDVLVGREVLKHLEIPGFNSQKGSPVLIKDPKSWGESVVRKGVVDKLMVNVEDKSKLVHLLIRVEDPLHLQKAPKKRYPLLINSMIRVKILGPKIKDVFKIPRQYKRGPNIWIFKNGKLDIRKISPYWVGRDYFLLKEGVSSGEKLITTNLATPVNKMDLRIKKIDLQNGKIKGKNRRKGKGKGAGRKKRGSGKK
ncbi:MAG: efflux RND transporter periplasmic adaptor subunit [Myxococcota bacterium]